jgi:hypothetical protein
MLLVGNRRALDERKIANSLTECRHQGLRSWPCRTASHTKHSALRVSLAPVTCPQPPSMHFSPPLWKSCQAPSAPDSSNNL